MRKLPRGEGRRGGVGEGVGVGVGVGLGVGAGVGVGVGVGEGVGPGGEGVGGSAMFIENVVVFKDPYLSKILKATSLVGGSCFMKVLLFCFSL